MMEPNDIDFNVLGAACIAAIIEGGMIRVQGAKEPVVFVWAGNASEQLGAAIRDAMHMQPRRRAVAGTSRVCRVCGCRWKIHANGWHQLYDAAQRPGACCDNASNPPLIDEEPPRDR